MSDKPVFLYVATYNNMSDAETDYEAVKALYKSGVIATYDAAIIHKDASGKVHVTKHEKPTQHGAWTGAAIGAVAGLIFPPSILVGAAVGAGVGALAGHLAFRPARPQASGRALDAASPRGQARDHCGSLYLQMGDRRAHG